MLVLSLSPIASKVWLTVAGVALLAGALVALSPSPLTIAAGRIASRQSIRIPTSQSSRPIDRSGSAGRKRQCLTNCQHRLKADPLLRAFAEVKLTHQRPSEQGKWGDLFPSPLRGFRRSGNQVGSAPVVESAIRSNGFGLAAWNCANAKLPGAAALKEGVMPKLQSPKGLALQFYKLAPR